jgi:hypothetical protein
VLAIDDTKKIENEVEKRKEVVTELVDEVSDSESTWGVYGTYSYLDLWLPSKLGLVVSYGDNNRVYELAYQSASYSFDYIVDDLGKWTDKRIHLTTRSHTWGSSFNFQYGAYYNSFSIDLGSNLTRLVGAQYDVIKIETVGAMFGVGNRWTWDNGLSIGSDWFRIFYPLAVVGEDTSFLDKTDDAGDKSDVQKVVDIVKSTPTITLVHFEIGYRF